MLIISGVDSFSQILDADKGERLESTTGRVAVRDIVQFVPLRDVQSRSHIINFSVNKLLDAEKDNQTSSRALPSRFLFDLTPLL